MENGKEEVYYLNIFENLVIDIQGFQKLADSKIDFNRLYLENIKRQGKIFV